MSKVFKLAMCAIGLVGFPLIFDCLPSLLETAFPITVLTLGVVCIAGTVGSVFYGFYTLNPDMFD